MGMSIKFISYDGVYPCLCIGNLKVEIAGVFNIGDSTVTLHHARVDLGKVKLISGGCWGFDDKGWEYTHKRPWHGIERLPEWIDEEAKKDLLRQINEHVEFGCCGGCI